MTQTECTTSVIPGTREGGHRAKDEHSVPELKESRRRVIVAVMLLVVVVTAVKTAVLILTESSIFFLSALSRCMCYISL